MVKTAVVRWGGLVIAVALVQGCGYLRHRADDAAEMFDVGLTFSKKPQFAAYTNCPIVVPVGYGKVDGYFVGVGGGKAGVLEHHERSAGLLVWGREEVSWDTFDESRAKTLHIEGAGLLGLAEARQSPEPYKPACKHYFHLGWVGLVGNIRWLEIPDFLVGWFLLDPSGDDGENGGWWFWRRREAAEAPTPETPAEATRRPEQ